MEDFKPRLEPSKVEAILATPDEALSGVDRQVKFIVAVRSGRMPCPMCFELCSIYEAGDDTCDAYGTYEGKYHCPNCDTELAQIRPFYMVPGTPGWHWQRKEPIVGKKQRAAMPPLAVGAPVSADVFFVGNNLSLDETGIVIATMRPDGTVPVRWDINGRTGWVPRELLKVVGAGR